MSLSFAAIILASQVGVAPPAVDHMDAAYDSLAAGRDAQVVAAIDAEEALDQQDPARLINLGVALARQGRTEAARAMFEAAEGGDIRYRLETADGSWTDSRRLAQRALAMLDQGAFESASRMAAR